MGNVDKVYVPIVYDTFTRTRVMVQEWIPGVKLSRYADIANMGFALKPIMTTVMSAFGHQLFVSGRVHGDPHPGRLLALHVHAPMSPDISWRCRQHPNSPQPDK
jgi:aarF domain-containing kinase